jgi:hypothetical protein
MLKQAVRVVTPAFSDERTHLLYAFPGEVQVLIFFGVLNVLMFSVLYLGILLR